jgi:hypothetical protein
MITPKLERSGQFEVPFQGAFFLGDGFPMALPWTEGEVPLAGRQIANSPENSHMWYQMWMQPRAEDREEKPGEINWVHGIA